MPAARTPTKRTANRAPARPTATKGAKKGAKKPRATPASRAAATNDAAGVGKRPRVFSMSFASVYPLYVQKAAKHGRTQAEVDEVIAWLTGYRGARLQRVLDARVDLERFFADAPRLTPHAHLITGVVCGVRVEEVADPLMRHIRLLDKLVDELARGWPMERILRRPA